MPPNDPLAALVAEHTHPEANDETRAVHRRILAAATDPARLLAEEELARVVRHIAGAGFDPHALERARGNLVGALRPNGEGVAPRDRLGPGEIHYLRHVVVGREWPDGTTPEEYFSNAASIVRDPSSRIFASRYQGVWQCGFIAKNVLPWGPQGKAWIIVDYRLSTGHWTTVFQWGHGPENLADPILDARREELRWLR